MFRRVLSLVLISLFGVVTSASADSKARVVRLSYVEGDAQIDRGDGNGFNTAFVNMPVIEGARVWTRDTGRLEVEFEDGSTVRLTPDSILTFSELALRGNGGRVSSLDLQEGTAYFNIRRDDDDDFRIAFGQHQVSLRDSSRFRLDLRRKEVALAVFRGKIEYFGTGGQRVDIRKNETLTLDLEDPSRYYLAKGITEEAHDYWDREREEDRIRYLAEQRERRYHNRYAYGYYDLYRHGSFFHVHGHGWVWRPFHVSIGWDPFGYGSWVWYPRRGYVWVSAYSWGWTPYHHGNWVFVGGRGWCWSGGGGGRTIINNYNFVNVTNVYNAPRHYRPPQAPVVAVNRPITPIVNVGGGITSRSFSPPGRNGEGFRANGRGDVDFASRGGKPGDIGRIARSGGVIDNDAIERTRPAVLPSLNGSDSNSKVATRTAIERPTRTMNEATERTKDRDGPTPSPRVSDPDYTGVDYRGNKGPTVSRIPTREDRGMRAGGPEQAVGDNREPVRAMPRPQPETMRPAEGTDRPARVDRTPESSNRPMRTDRTPAYEPRDNGGSDRGDRGMSAGRSSGMPSSAPATSAPSRPSPPPSAPSMSAPPARSSAPPSGNHGGAGRESRGSRNKPN